jgi:Domain of unknown function (DUF1707)/Domain of unknown function (DUF4190)
MVGCTQLSTGSAVISVRTVAGTNGTCRVGTPGCSVKVGVVQMNDNDTASAPDGGTLPRADKLQRIADDERGLRTAVPRVIPSVERTRAFPPGGERGKMRAADADRDRVVEFLNTAYSEGRLSKDEYDARLENALSAQTYADLDQLVTDLPAMWATMVPSVARTTVMAPVAKTNGLAIASLACGVAQFAFGPVATIPAIVLGHVARHQIKRTGEQGAGLALAGLILGWAAVVLGIILIIVGMATFAGMHGTMRMH